MVDLTAWYGSALSRRTPYVVRNSASAYAVTDIRVIVVRNGRNMSVPLAWINRVNGGDSANSLLALFSDHPVNAYPGKQVTRPGPL